ncbi:MAG: hypothetical protein P8Y02_08065 [Deinococcales bacterium]
MMPAPHSVGAARPPERRRRSLAMTLLTVALAFVALVTLVWLGFQMPFAGFEPPPAAAAPERYPIPTDEPAPVATYLRAVSTDGATLPRITSAVYWGYGSARPFGVWLPLRHQAVIVPGSSMVRTMEFPWYGITLLHVEDTYQNGAGATTLRGLLRQRTSGPHTDQAAFLALASESILLPSADALGARWEAIDEHTARLRFPFKSAEETLVVTFDPSTGLPQRISAQRYKSEAGGKVPWHIDVSDWAVLDGLRMPTRFDVSWGDEPGPWSRWTIEGVALDANAPGAAERR